MAQQADRFITEASEAIQRGESQRALDLANHAAGLMPLNGDAHLVRGIACSQLGQAGGAIAAFDRAIELAPHDVKGYYNLSLHYFRLGFRDEAIRSARQALSVEGSHGGATTLLEQLSRMPEPDFSGPVQPIEAGIETIPPQEAPAALGEVVPPPVVLPPPVTPPPPYGTMYYGQPGGYYPHQEVPTVQATHSLRFVESLGVAWTMAGIGIAVLSLYSTFRLWQVLLSDEEASALMRTDAGVQWIIVFNFLVVTGLALAWLIADLADRSGPWFWAGIYVAAVCVGCWLGSPGLPWLFIPIYFAARRKVVARNVE